MISLVKYQYFNEAMGTFGKVATGLGAGALYTIGALSSRGEDIPKINKDSLSNLRKVIPKSNIDNLPTKPNIPNVDTSLDKENAREQIREKQLRNRIQQLKSQSRTSGTFVGGKLQPKGYNDSNLTFQQKIERAAKNQASNMG